MNNYETMYILRPDLTDDQVNLAIDKYRNLIREQGATDIEVQNRGKHRLAYEIKRQRDGVYIQMNYNGNGAFVAPMERAMRLSDEVIRYLTVKEEVAATPKAEEPVAVEA